MRQVSTGTCTAQPLNDACLGRAFCCCNKPCLVVLMLCCLHCKSVRGACYAAKRVSLGNDALHLLTLASLTSLTLTRLLRPPALQAVLLPEEPSASTSKAVRGSSLESFSAVRHIHRACPSCAGRPADREDVRLSCPGAVRSGGCALPGQHCPHASQGLPGDPAAPPSRCNRRWGCAPLAALAACLQALLQHSGSAVLIMTMTRRALPSLRGLHSSVSAAEPAQYSCGRLEISMVPANCGGVCDTLWDLCLALLQALQHMRILMCPAGECLWPAWQTVSLPLCPPRCGRQATSGGSQLCRHHGRHCPSAAAAPQLWGGRSGQGAVGVRGAG